MMRLDISLLSLSNLMRKELLNASTCVMKFYHPALKNKKKLEANKRTVYQLLELMEKTSDDMPKTYRCTNKISCSHVSRKVCFALFGGFKLVSNKIYTHYTFEQARFKRDFDLMNQKSRENAKNAIKKEFFQLMNNTNFGFDCRNNANSVTFEPIIDEINEISYIKNYYSPFDTNVSGFVNSYLLKQEIQQTFQQRLN